MKYIMRSTGILAAAVLCAAASVAPAQAGTISRWRLDQQIGAAADNTDPAVASPGDSGIAAGSQDSAWALWANGRSEYVTHWNGHRWVQVPANALAGLAKYGADAVAASPADAWVLGSGRHGAHEIAWHWNGAKWSQRWVPTWVVRGNLAGEIDVQTADFGPRDVWAFSLFAESMTKTVSYAARYLDGRWEKVVLPAIPEAISAVSANDIWALGAKSSTDYAGQELMHWTGHSWHVVRLPRLRFPAKTTAFAQAMAADGRTDVWLSVETETGLAGASTDFLLHLTSHGWAKVQLARGIDDAGLLAPDGRGGIWAAGNGSAPRYKWEFFHLLAGHWSTYAVPAPPKASIGGVQEFIQVPGTASLWAVGHAFVPYKSNSDNVGEIWRYSA